MEVCWRLRLIEMGLLEVEEGLHGSWRLVKVGVRSHEDKNGSLLEYVVSCDRG